jgi:hypothetical protein
MWLSSPLLCFELSTDRSAHKKAFAPDERTLLFAVERILSNLLIVFFFFWHSFFALHYFHSNLRESGYLSYQHRDCLYVGRFCFSQQLPLNFYRCATATFVVFVKRSKKKFSMYVKGHL